MPNPQMNDTTTRKITWLKHARIQAGQLLKVMVDDTVLAEKTIPAGKVFDGSILVDGELKDA